LHRDLSKLTEKKFDILVIGGGITGACIVHDAALRGFSVALIEKEDFGSYTSSASSKLLHGGIRYLPKAQFRKIRESAREQAIFQHLAPHLTHWIPFLIPTKKDKFIQGSFAMKLAMFIYQVLCAGLYVLIRDPAKKPPRTRFYLPDELFNLIPFLKNAGNITGGQELWESHMYSSERMVLAFIKTAVKNGAIVANYTEIQKLIINSSRVVGAQATDLLTGESFAIEADLVINAAGPYVQAVNKNIKKLQLTREITGFSRGVHLVTRQIEPRYALALTTRKKTEGIVTRGGRHFFIIPWRGKSLIGTTNVPYKRKLDEIRVTEKDISEFLEEINEAAPGITLRRDDVFYAFTGIYPLISQKIIKDTYQGTGEYQIVDHQKSDKIDGIVTALGAKYTTARHVAEKTIDLVIEKLNSNGPKCRTFETRLAEGDIEDIKEFRRQCVGKYSRILERGLIEHLIRYHGTEIDRIVELGLEKSLLNKLCEGREVLEVEVYYAVKYEMARTLDDMVFRRTGLGTIGHPGEEALEKCADIMGELLGWNRDEKGRQIARIMERYSYNN